MLEIEDAPERRGKMVDGANDMDIVGSPMYGICDVLCCDVMCCTISTTNDKCSFAFSQLHCTAPLASSFHQAPRAGTLTSSRRRLHRCAQLLPGRYTLVRGHETRAKMKSLFLSFKALRHDIVICTSTFQSHDSHECSLSVAVSQNTTPATVVMSSAKTIRHNQAGVGP
jgi:hypothetical protein